METEKVADATPEPDPFAATIEDDLQAVAATREDYLQENQAIAEEAAERSPELAPEPEPEPEPEETVQERVSRTAEDVRQAEANLETARKEYSAAAQAQATGVEKLTLVEMNRIQKKVTASEVRHKNRAMKALGELGFGNQPMKPHPTLFKTGE